MKRVNLKSLLVGLALVALAAGQVEALTDKQAKSLGLVRVGKGADKDVWSLGNGKVLLTPREGKKGAEATLRREAGGTAEAIKAGFSNVAKISGATPGNLAVDFQAPEGDLATKLKALGVNYAVVTPEAKGGDVEKFLKKNAGKLSLADRVNIGSQLALGKAQLNEAGFAFGDGKLGNSLLNERVDAHGNIERVVQISDFGKTKKVGPNEALPNRGNTRNLSPEVKNSMKNDSWALAGEIMEALGGNYEKEVVKKGIGINQQSAAGKIKRLAFEVRQAFLGGKTEAQKDRQVAFMNDHLSQMITALKSQSPEHAASLEKIQKTVEGLIKKDPSQRMSTTEASVRMAEAGRDMAQVEAKVAAEKLPELKAQVEKLRTAGAPETEILAAEAKVRAGEKEASDAKLKLARAELGHLQAEGLSLDARSAKLTQNEQKQLAESQADLIKKANAKVETASSEATAADVNLKRAKLGLADLVQRTSPSAENDQARAKALQSFDEANRLAKGEPAKSTAVAASPEGTNRSPTEAKKAYLSALTEYNALPETEKAKKAKPTREEFMPKNFQAKAWDAFVGGDQAPEKTVNKTVDREPKATGKSENLARKVGRNAIDPAQPDTAKGAADRRENRKAFADEKTAQANERAKAGESEKAIKAKAAELALRSTPEAKLQKMLLGTPTERDAASHELAMRSALKDLKSQVDLELESKATKLQDLHKAAVAAGLSEQSAKLLKAEADNATKEANASKARSTLPRDEPTMAALREMQAARAIDEKANATEDRLAARADRLANSVGDFEALPVRKQAAAVSKQEVIEAEAQVNDLQRKRSLAVLAKQDSLVSQIDGELKTAKSNALEKKLLSMHKAREAVAPETRGEAGERRAMARLNAKLSLAEERKAWKEDQQRSVLEQKLKSFEEARAKWTSTKNKTGLGKWFINKIDAGGTHGLSEKKMNADYEKLAKLNGTTVEEERARFKGTSPAEEKAKVNAEKAQNALRESLALVERQSSSLERSQLQKVALEAANTSLERSSAAREAHGLAAAGERRSALGAKRESFGKRLVAELRASVGGHTEPAKPGPGALHTLGSPSGTASRTAVGTHEGTIGAKPAAGGPTATRVRSKSAPSTLETAAHEAATKKKAAAQTAIGTEKVGVTHAQTTQVTTKETKSTLTKAKTTAVREGNVFKAARAATSAKIKGAPTIGKNRLKVPTATHTTTPHK